MNVFLTTNPGLEKGLKEEVRLRFPTWRPAFSAPGFLTYATDKEWSARDLAKAPFLFARWRGPVMQKIPYAEGQVVEASMGWGVRDLAAPAVMGVPAENGEVLDAIRIGAEHVLMARHLHTDWEFMHVPFAAPFIMPEESPSRAYLKLREACAFAGIAPTKGESALELGSSPGGASYALLEMGAKVLGVDTGPMHASCLGNKNFRHLPWPMQTITRKEIGNTKIDWLVCDVNLRPRETWGQLRRFLDLLAPGPRALLWTVKMTDWDQLPLFMRSIWFKLEEEFKAAGAKRVRTAFLPSHHREFLVVLEF